MSHSPENITQSDINIMGIRNKNFPIWRGLCVYLMVQSIKKLLFFIFHVSQ